MARRFGLVTLPPPSPPPSSPLAFSSRFQQENSRISTRKFHRASTVSPFHRFFSVSVPVLGFSRIFQRVVFAVTRFLFLLLPFFSFSLFFFLLVPKASSEQVRNEGIDFRGLSANLLSSRGRNPRGRNIIGRSVGARVVLMSRLRIQKR